ncbi:MAG: lysophospholipid acyltransferase family protein [Pirellulaceae bacterium]
MSQATQAQKIVGSIAGTALPLISQLMDYRVSSFAPENDPAHPNHGSEKCLFVFWHEFIAALIPRWGWRNLTILVSQHRDAEWLNQVAARMGFNMTRGSSTRGGQAAIRRMKQVGMESSLAITPDGPKGPRRQMALGALYIASELQMPIVPIGVALKRHIRLNTWDRFAVPFPGSKIRVVFGPKIRLPRVDDRQDLDCYRDSVSNSINSMTELAENWLAGNETLPSYRPIGLWRKPREKASDQKTIEKCCESPKRHAA